MAEWDAIFEPKRGPDDSPKGAPGPSPDEGEGEHAPERPLEVDGLRVAARFPRSARLRDGSGKSGSADGARSRKQGPGDASGRHGRDRPPSSGSSSPSSYPSSATSSRAWSRRAERRPPIKDHPEKVRTRPRSGGVGLRWKSGEERLRSTAKTLLKHAESLQDPFMKEQFVSGRRAPSRALTATSPSSRSSSRAILTLTGITRATSRTSPPFARRSRPTWGARRAWTIWAWTRAGKNFTRRPHCPGHRTRESYRHRDGTTGPRARAHLAR